MKLNDIEKEKIAKLINKEYDYLGFFSRGADLVMITKKHHEELLKTRN